MESKYIPLYRKYRPQTFYDLIGQENIVHALSNAIKLNRIAHAYLLTGPRGTGKTSSARILAKSLNCKEGPTLTPCGKCPACLDIINSVPVDVIEIDAASNRSVEDTQAILEKIQYVPVNGRYKIYVIDEVHMLSNHAFNALLKTLEEPPENVIFILATTEPHKVLDTIISRCQRFDFRRITTEDIVKRLEQISEKENINISKSALYLIAKNSQGGMRDALALLDQISVLGTDREINTDDINELLGKISYDKLNEIAEFIANGNTSKSVELIDEVYAKGNEPVQLVNNLIQYFRDLMIIKNCDNKELIFNLTQINETNYDKNKALADKFSSSEFIQIIDRLSYYAIQIKDTTNKYLWLELCIIDITNYKNLPSMENLVKRIEMLEAQINSPDVPKIQVSQPVIQHYIPENVKREEVKQEISAPPKKIEAPQKIEAPKQEIPVNKPVNISNDLHNLWVSTVQSITSPTAKAYFQKAQAVELSEKRVLIAFANDMFIKMADKNKKQALCDAITSYTGIKNPNIEIILTSDIPADIALTQEVPKVQNIKSEQSCSVNDAAQGRDTRLDTETEDNPPSIDVQKQEEEEYQHYVEAKEKETDTQKTTEEQPLKNEEQPQDYITKSDISSQANMVKDLFDGKFI